LRRFRSSVHRQSGQIDDHSLKDLFTGQWRCPGDGSAYAWGVEVLCDCFGTRLPDGVFFGSTPVDWFNGVDAWLAAEQVPLRFLDLVYREPITLPPLNDWPQVGHWTPEEIRTAAPLVDRLLPRRAEDGFVRALGQVQEWFRVALAEPDLCLVGFYG
jgi:hypothetical protein